MGSKGGMGYGYGRTKKRKEVLQQALRRSLIGRFDKLLQLRMSTLHVY